MSDPIGDPSSSPSAPATAAAPPPVDASRRRFLGLVAGAGGCALGAAMIGGPLTVTLAPALKGAAPSGPAQWMPIARVDDLQVGAAPTRVVLRATLRDGWLVRENQPIGSVLVQRTAPDTFRVFSASCPHLGCAVAWADDAGAYMCPCHGAVFKEDGALAPKLDGGQSPAKRGLDALEHRVSASGHLEVRWQRFQLDVADKVAVAS